MKYSTAVTINKPVGEVWTFFENPDNLHLWQEGLKKHQHISGNPKTVGAKAKQVFEEGNRHVEMEEEVVERVPEEKLKLKKTHPMVKTRIVYRFIDNGGQTEVIADTDMHFQSFVYSLLEPFMKGSFQKRQQADLERLKEVLEGR